MSYACVRFGFSSSCSHSHTPMSESVRPSYDRVCEHDDRIIDGIKSAEQARRYRVEIEHRAEEFVRQYWRALTRLADKIFKHGRLDRQRIEAVFAPPPLVARAMPRRPGDEPNFFRRCDGYFR
jgi:hypothetical protein